MKKNNYPYAQKRSWKKSYIKKLKKNANTERLAQNKFSNITITSPTWHIQKRYEIDNHNLPEGLPPIEPFLPDWIGSAPVLGESVELKQKLNENKKLGKKLVIASPEKQAFEKKIREQIIETLQSAGHAMSTNEFYSALPEVAQLSVKDALDEMLKNGDLFFSKSKRIALPSQMGYATGKLQTTGRGFGFFIPDDDSDDVYVPQEMRKNAQNGDRVVVKVVAGQGKHDKEGEVISIIEHKNTNVVGTIKKSEETNQYYIDPDNKRFDMDMHITKKQIEKSKAKAGQKVFASIDYDTVPITVNIMEVLGYPGDSDTEILAIVRSADLPYEFSPETLEQAAQIPTKVSEDDMKWREDLRPLMMVTIDGAESKDFDDAVSCDMLENGNYLLGVHIADVAHYVKEDSPLDKDAYERGTSVYFLDRVIPMLPESLSNGICSLNPRVDRLAMTCFMEINHEGMVVKSRFAQTVIRSKRRLTYHDVTAALNGVKTQSQRLKSVMPMLERMQKLSDLLAEKRELRGSIDFDLPEAQIVTDEDGKPTKIVLRERGISNRIIESFMLLCNETMARQLNYLDLPVPYRVHEAPDETRVDELNVYLKAHGYYLKNDKGRVSPTDVRNLLEEVRGSAQEASISRVVLRSFKKAVYSEDEVGHFGLAAEYYLHFTSPIRRYPDLITQRVLKEMINGYLTPKSKQRRALQMPDTAEHCSERERAAIDVEREIEDLKKCEYMEQFVGQEFVGYISGVTSFGLFVELPNTCEGLIRIHDMSNDYYIYDEKHHSIVGRSTGQIYRLGNEIKIRVESVDINMRRVDFVPILPEVKKKKPGTASQKRKQSFSASDKNKNTKMKNNTNKPATANKNTTKTGKVENIPKTKATQNKNAPQNNVNKNTNKSTNKAAEPKVNKENNKPKANTNNSQAKTPNNQPKAKQNQQKANNTNAKALKNKSSNAKKQPNTEVQKQEKKIAKNETEQTGNARPVPARSSYKARSASKVGQVAANYAERAEQQNKPANKQNNQQKKKNKPKQNIE